MKDKPATMGLVAWHDRIEKSDASVVQLFKKAGGMQDLHDTLYLN